MAQSTNSLTLVELPITHRPDSTQTNSSKVSRVTKSLKKTSIKFDQKIEKLKTRINKPKEARPEIEKRQATKQPQTVVQPRDEGESSMNLAANKQYDVKKARREARRAKWAARRASLKEFAKKAGKAVALSGGVILGLIFGPVLIVVDLAFAVVGLVARLIVELVGLICAPFYVCFIW